MKWVKTIDELHLPCLSLLSINIKCLSAATLSCQGGCGSRGSRIPTSDLSASVESWALKIRAGFINFCPPAPWVHSPGPGLSFLWMQSQLMSGIRAQECSDRGRCSTHRCSNEPPALRTAEMGTRCWVCFLKEKHS